MSDQKPERIVQAKEHIKIITEKKKERENSKYPRNGYKKLKWK